MTEMTSTAERRWKLATSNEKKLAEYRRLGLPAEIGEAGEDLAEPEAGGDEVSLRKALAGGAMTVAEDTSLDIEGVAVGANVRWLMDELPKLAGRRASFKVWLASFDGETLRAYLGEVQGTIVEPKGPGGFGFDPVFAPDGGGGLTLAELEAAGRKDEFSARRLATEAFVAGRALRVETEASLGEWAGAWQGGSAPERKKGPSR